MLVLLGLLSVTAKLLRKRLRCRRAATIRFPMFSSIPLTVVTRPPSIDAVLKAQYRPDRHTRSTPLFWRC